MVWYQIRSTHAAIASTPKCLSVAISSLITFTPRSHNLVLRWSRKPVSFGISRFESGSRRSLRSLAPRLRTSGSCSEVPSGTNGRSSLMESGSFFAEMHRVSLSEHPILKRLRDYANLLVIRVLAFISTFTLLLRRYRIPRS